jgi:hypothetical protein
MAAQLVVLVTISSPLVCYCRASLEMEISPQMTAANCNSRWVNCCHGWGIRWSNKELELPCSGAEAICLKIRECCPLAIFLLDESDRTHRNLIKYTCDAPPTGLIIFQRLQLSRRKA